MIPIAFLVFIPFDVDMNPDPQGIVNAPQCIFCTTQKDSAKLVSQSKKKHLTAAESSKIRAIIYNEPLSTRNVPIAPYRIERELIVPPALFEIHSKKPTATIELLLMVVNGGRPRDAIKAGALAIALQEGGAVAALVADCPEAGFDDSDGGKSETMRLNMVNWIERNRAK